MNDSIGLYDEAFAAFNRRDWRQALALSSRLLSQAPDHAGLHYVAGIAALELQALPEAISHLQQASALEPTHADYLAQAARALTYARRTRESLLAADRAMALAPREAMTLDTLGVVYTLGNAHASAVEVFRQAVALMPASAHFQFNLATSLVATGELAEAERALEACLALDAHCWRAHLSLAQLRTATAERNHVARLNALAPAAASDQLGSTYIQLALAKEHEDLGDYATSLQHLTAGKHAIGRTRGYASKRDEALFEAIAQAFPQPEQHEGGFDSAEPIFIIGMPRSGTTLVERIISSHPDVHSAGELKNFGMLLKRASGSNTPMLLDPPTVQRAQQLDWQGLGRAYIDSTRPGTGHTPRFIDKLPHNFLYAGFIARALPKARIICLRRNAMDVCLSNFRQLFTPGAPQFDYSLDLLDTGRYYVLFDRLMAHWQRVLPGRILELQYEALVDAQEAQSRRIVDYCGLPWDDACLAFHRNAAPVATASSVQVREPLNRASVDRWKRYGAPLDELAALLRDADIALS